MAEHDTELDDEARKHLLRSEALYVGVMAQRLVDAGNKERRILSG